jgi:hypothetical protein
MKCPHCDSEMQVGTVRVATSAIGSWYGFFSAFRGVVQVPRSLYFTPAGESKQDVLFDEGVPREGHRCQECHAVVLFDRSPAPSVPLVPPPKPPEWLVRIAEKQQTKAQRRAFYDCLSRKHRIPHKVASPKAGEFKKGLKVEIPFQERQRAQTIVDDLRHLGLVAEVVEPATAEKLG